MCQRSSCTTGSRGSLCVSSTCACSRLCGLLQRVLTSRVFPCFPFYDVKMTTTTWSLLLGQTACLVPKQPSSLGTTSVGRALLSSIPEVGMLRFAIKMTPGETTCVSKPSLPLSPRTCTNDTNSSTCNILSLYMLSTGHTDPRSFPNALLATEVELAGECLLRIFAQEHVSFGAQPAFPFSARSAADKLLKMMNRSVIYISFH